MTNKTKWYICVEDYTHTFIDPVGNNAFWPKTELHFGKGLEIGIEGDKLFVDGLTYSTSIPVEDIQNFFKEIEITT